MICMPICRPPSVCAIGMVVAGSPFEVAIPAHAIWLPYGTFLRLQHEVNPVVAEIHFLALGQLGMPEEGNRHLVYEQSRIESAVKEICQG